MLETGVPNLDLLLGGGVPEGDTLLVLGPAGAGKTTLSLQMAFSAASRGENCVFISTLSEPPNKLVRHIRPFSFFDASEVGKHLFLLGIYPLVKEGLDAVMQALVGAVAQHRASLVVIDGLMTLRDLHPDLPRLRTLIFELGDVLGGLGCTTVITSSGGAEPDSFGHELPEMTMADGIVTLGWEASATALRRVISTRKMRGLDPLLGQHAYRIDQDGLTVFPRVAALGNRAEPRPPTSGAPRVSMGSPELDAMMGGGPPAGSSSLLAGAFGTGKTVTGLQFLLEGARAGSPGLLFSLGESPAELVEKSRALGLDLEGFVDSGLITLVGASPVEVDPDELVFHLLRALEGRPVERLVFDSISPLEKALDQRVRWSFWSALARVLQGRNVTSLLTKDVGQVVGPELDFSDSPLAGLADNLLLLRYVEFEGSLKRFVSVLKMRNSPSDSSIREYEIDAGGMRVLSAPESAEGLLTGVARLPSEARVKRRPEEDAT